MESDIVNDELVNVLSLFCSINDHKSDFIILKFKAIKLYCRNVQNNLHISQTLLPLTQALFVLLLFCV